MVDPYNCGGIARLGSGGYVDQYGIGGFFKKLAKGIGGIGATLLGTALGGPLGAALAGGLYSGLTEKSLKKGLLGGLGAFVGAKALSGIADAASGTIAAKEAGLKTAASKAAQAGTSTVARGPVAAASAFLPEQVGVTLPNQLARTAVQQTPLYGNALSRSMQAARMLGPGKTGKAALDTLSDPKMLSFVYPQMGNLLQSIEQDKTGGSGRDPYYDELRKARKLYEQRFGKNPYASLYMDSRAGGGMVNGYAGGGNLFSDLLRRWNEMQMGDNIITTTTDSTDPRSDPGYEGDDDPGMEGGDLGDVGDVGTGIDTGYDPGTVPDAEKEQDAGTVGGVGRGEGSDDALPPPIPIDDPDDEDDYGSGDPSDEGPQGPEVPWDDTGDPDYETFFGGQRPRPIDPDFIPGLMPEYDYFTSGDRTHPIDMGEPPADPFGREAVAAAMTPDLLMEYISGDFTTPPSERASGGMVGYHGGGFIGQQNFMEGYGTPWDYWHAEETGAGHGQHTAMNGNGYNNAGIGGLRGGFAGGGQVGAEGEQLVEMAAAALMGQMPPDQAEGVLQAFVQAFGPEALEQLKAMVSQQQAAQPDTEGLLDGPGGGLDDQILASVKGGDPVALSSGEFIVPADVVSMLGDGDSSSGADKLDNLISRVRKEKTGTTQQADPISRGILSGVV